MKEKDLNVFRLLRIARDLSVKEIAEELRVTPAYINQIENGEKYPSNRLLKHYAEVLGVSEETILTFKPDENKDNTSLFFERTLLKLLKKICDL